MALPLPVRAALFGALVLAAPAAAQSPTAQPPTGPEPIEDNSFLIEEAYNQGPHVVQHIGTMQRTAAANLWAFSFTQEWPVVSQRHQLSATVPFMHVDDTSGPTGLGDVALNYRYQATGVDGGHVLVAPRLSLVLPTGRASEGLGTGAAGVQVNLPVSIELPARLVTHLNAGATYTPGAQNASGAKANTTAYNLGQSLIWLATPTVNLMLEAAWTSFATVAAEDVTQRERSFVLAPGFRFARNVGGLQIVPGAAYVVGVGPSAGERSVFTYLSFEHPF
jgi:hypothetical protein